MTSVGRCGLYMEAFWTVVTGRKARRGPCNDIRDDWSHRCFSHFIQWPALHAGTPQLFLLAHSVCTRANTHHKLPTLSHAITTNKQKEQHAKPLLTHRPSRSRRKSHGRHSSRLKYHAYFLRPSSSPCVRPIEAHVHTARPASFLVVQTKMRRHPPLNARPPRRHLLQSHFQAAAICIAPCASSSPASRLPPPSTINVPPLPIRRTSRPPQSPPLPSPSSHTIRSDTPRSNPPLLQRCPSSLRQIPSIRPPSNLPHPSRIHNPHSTIPTKSTPQLSRHSVWRHLPRR